MKQEYWINVKHVDNRMLIFINGETVWDSGIVHNDPDMDVFIDITDHLFRHINHSVELIFEGFNDSYDAEEGDLNPWHFEYRILERVADDAGRVMSEQEMISGYNEKHQSNPNIRAMNNCYRVVRKDNSFKVVSNSLSQNFYN